MSADAVLRFPENFPDDAVFFRMALAKFLRQNHLPSVLFYELTPDEQSKILSDAQGFKAMHQKRYAVSSGHEGAVE